MPSVNVLGKDGIIKIFSFSTLEQLKIDIVNNWWDALVGRRFHLRFPDRPTTEITLSSILSHKSDVLLHIHLDKLKRFSKITPDEAIKYAQLKVFTLSCIPKGVQSDFIADIALPDEEIIKKETDYIFDDLQRRIQCLDLDRSVECTMREFISPLLIGAMMTANEKGLKLICEENIEGEFGHGPVDYMMTYKSVNIVLTEAKMENIEAGVAKNICQIVASREQHARYLAKLLGTKRKYDDLLSEMMRVASYGIITTGEEWYFLRYCGTDLIRSERLNLNLNIDLDQTDWERRRKDIEVLLRWILGVIKTQVTIMNNFPTI